MLCILSADYYPFWKYPRLLNTNSTLHPGYMVHGYSELVKVITCKVIQIVRSTLIGQNQGLYYRYELHKG